MIWGPRNFQENVTAFFSPNWTRDTWPKSNVVLSETCWARLERLPLSSCWLSAFTIFYNLSIDQFIKFSTKEFEEEEKNNSPPTGRYECHKGFCTKKLSSVQTFCQWSNARQRQRKPTFMRPYIYSSSSLEISNGKISNKYSTQFHWFSRVVIYTVVSRHRPQVVGVGDKHKASNFVINLLGLGSRHKAVDFFLFNFAFSFFLLQFFFLFEIYFLKFFANFFTEWSPSSLSG